MKIYVLGTRGIPDIPGGVEKHCQQLYPRIAAKGHDVTVCTRRPYVKIRTPRWNNVQLKHCFTLHHKSVEAILHTLLGLILARTNRPDLVHIHAIGPALLTPLAKLMGLKVVLTHHGPDYRRQKWNGFAKKILKLGEKLGGIFADEVISISPEISKILAQRCKCRAHLVCNGIDLPNDSVRTEFLDRIGVEPGNYILSVARLVPEKGIHDLLAAYKLLDTDKKLVIAGDADHETSYSKKVKATAASDRRVVMTGYITGEKLAQVYRNAKLFVLPSYHEGHPIVLLEALSYGLPILASDITANMNLELPSDQYFALGNSEDLKKKMEQLVSNENEDGQKAKVQKMIKEKYNWDHIAGETMRIYGQALRQQST